MKRKLAKLEKTPLQRQAIYQEQASKNEKLAKLEKTPLQRQAIYQEQASKNKKLAKLEKTPLQRQAIYQEHASKNKKLVKLEKMLLEGKKGKKGKKGEKGGEMDLAKGALLASGVETEQEFNRYLPKVDRLCQRIADTLCDLLGKGSDWEKAEGIFDWLWRAKPHRYEYGGSFRLAEVLDAQLGESDKVGNCLGLTLLYNVLVQRFGLVVGAAYLEDAFGLGPHLFTVLYTGGRTIDIENIFPHGFDYRGHRVVLEGDAVGESKREEWGSRELIADIYHSVANEFFASGKWERAIENYDKAITLHPKYTRAYLNKGIALVQMGRTEEAREWFR